MSNVDDYEDKRFSDIIYTCQKCKKEFDWTAMSDETDMQLCEGCDMDEMYDDIKNKVHE